MGRLSLFYLTDTPVRENVASVINFYRDRGQSGRLGWLLNWLDEFAFRPGMASWRLDVDNRRLGAIHRRERSRGMIQGGGMERHDWWSWGIIR